MLESRLGLFGGGWPRFLTRAAMAGSILTLGESYFWSAFFQKTPNIIGHQHRFAPFWEKHLSFQKLYTQGKSNTSTSLAISFQEPQNPNYYTLKQSPWWSIYLESRLKQVDYLQRDISLSEIPKRSSLWKLRASTFHAPEDAILQQNSHLIFPTAPTSPRNDAVDSNKLS